MDEKAPAARGWQVTLCNYKARSFRRPGFFVSRLDATRFRQGQRPCSAGVVGERSPPPFIPPYTGGNKEVNAAWFRM